MAEIGILFAPAMKRVHEKPDGERWCFVCRSRQEFTYTVDAPVDIYSYYGPTRSIRCSKCDTVDGDLFPGRYREWEE